MSSLLIRGEVPPDDLQAVLRNAGAEIQGASAYAFGTTRIALFVGRKHYFRTDSYLGIALVASTDGTAQRIDIGHAGGGSGLLGTEWGAGDDLETNVYNGVLALLRERGLSAQG